MTLAAPRLTWKEAPVWLAGKHAVFLAGALSACRGDATANPPAPSENTTPTDAAVETTQMRVRRKVRSCEVDFDGR